MENETRVMSDFDDAVPVDVLSLLGHDANKAMRGKFAEPWIVGTSGNPAGRPLKRLPPPAIIERLAQHFTESEIAAIAGVAPQTLSRRKHTDPALVEAITRGRSAQPPKPAFMQSTKNTR